MRTWICLVSIAVIPFCAWAREPEGEEEEHFQEGSEMRQKHQAPDPAQHLEHLKKELKLKDGQEPKIKKILEETKTKMEPVHQKMQVVMEKMKAVQMEMSELRYQMRKAQRETQEKIREVLNPEQRMKFDEISERRERKVEIQKKKFIRRRGDPRSRKFFDEDEDSEVPDGPPEIMHEHPKQPSPSEKE